MRRVRAAVIHTSRWPSYGTARIATPPPRIPRSFALLFPLPPPRVQTDQLYIGSSSAPPNGTASAEIWGGNLGKFAVRAAVIHILDKKV